MCDTLVVLGNSTQDGSVLFAKNSDRQPNEPHIMIRVPRRQYNRNSSLKTTYITIPQVEETFEIMLLKPSWIWGCEMGGNEFGLNIGNEAVFTKEKYGPPALLGMDMARIALERCRNTEEAVELIVHLLEIHGQGGNCGFEKPFTYHNSFLIADPNSAWVLETAGQYWAAKKVTDIYCISNCLTIGADFDQCHPDLIKHAIAKGWCRNEKEFSFCDCYTNHLVTHLSGANERLNTCRSMLDKEKGQITVDAMK
ncbi:MAG: peptidase C69 [Firmicutes bacterium]|nr:peptidase C69 [Bacillota bacterium]